MQLEKKKYKSKVLPHDNKRLQEGVRELGIFEEHVLGFFRVLLDASLHLLHQLKHLLWRQRRHCLRNRLGSLFRIWKKQV